MTDNRFQILLAEIEGIKNICSKCNTQLEELDPIKTHGIGQISANIFRYQCRECERVYIYEEEEYVGYRKTGKDSSF